ncbi:hypothetical protein FHS18_003287 [Paenibacillus phyllosphaerae]|uniref:Uncharacterized protein n=1 Tax=Paenibacillus phyllosphaerae TaxID=274593 RepID=A0A7W5AZA6_9BACL|nr:hypothetical protein [Paenibacillus phyllosphaerae]MBB3111219.1 hypothetical protein [Paenibacillus phyllosphaerae]
MPKEMIPLPFKRHIHSGKISAEVFQRDKPSVKEEAALYVKRKALDNITDEFGSEVLENEDADVSLSNVTIRFSEEPMTHEEGFFKKKLIDSKKLIAEAEADILIED